jgi:hypothetical protein
MRYPLGKKVRADDTDTTLQIYLISREPSTPLCFLLQFRPRPPPISFPLGIHLLQESLHPLFRLVYRQSTRTSLPIRFSVRYETFSSA